MLDEINLRNLPDYKMNVEKKIKSLDKKKDGNKQCFSFFKQIE